MPFSSSSLVLCVLVALCCAVGSTASISNTMIYIDNTFAFFVILPSTQNATRDPHTYVGSGTMSFTLDWNGDVSDTVTFSAVANPATNKGSIAITAVGTNASYCGAGIPNMASVVNSAVGAVTLTPVNTNCTYQVVFTQWGGEVSLDYQNGTTSDTVDIFFTPTVILGDPQFVGLRGQSYQVHGIDGAIYNIISDRNLQVNGKFTFLTEGQCPIIDGVPDTNCWSHPGSYIGEMSFQQVVDGKLHAALITSGDAKTGFSMVQMNGQVVPVGHRISFGSFSLTRHSAYSVTVQTEQFSFDLSNSDFFINQALAPKVSLSQLQSHGLLGQTHSTKVHASPLRYIEGEVDDYVIADSDIFGDDFLFNKFQQ